MLREVDRRAEERRAVHAVDEPVDDRLREQFQVARCATARGSTNRAPGGIAIVVGHR
jgi:hypothetical protein